MLTPQDIRGALGNELLSEQEGVANQFAGVTNDSRTARPGQIFVALATENRDGHDYVDHAIAQGVTGLIVQDDIRAPEGVAVFRVRDSQHALGEIAKWWRGRFATKCIAITGNVGKTSTKELTAAVLARHHTVLKTPANFNNEVGVSMTLLDLDERHDRAILEVGMFALGEIRRLCEIARPEIGVVLNVGPTHLERLGSLEAIADAKAEAIESLPSTGTAILNHDDALVAPMASRTRARVLTFGLKAGADFQATEVCPRRLAGVDFTLNCLGRRLPAHSPLPGADLVPNALAAIAVATADGMALEEAVHALSVASVTPRLQSRAAVNGATILDDCYNASPASTVAALGVLAEMPGRRLALLGDMLELGSEEADGHRRVGRQAAATVDLLYTIGERAHLIAEAAADAGLASVRHFETRAEAVAKLAEGLKSGDVLLVKASHGMALEEVVGELTV